MAFRPVQLNQPVDPRLTGTIQYDPNAVAPAGFVPLDPVAASRVKPALTLEQQLALGHAGEIPYTSQPEAAFSRGALDTALAGTTEAAASLAGANPKYDPNGPALTNPYTYSLGEILGTAIPVGRIAKAGKGVFNLVKEGARLGGIYGLGRGVSSAAQEENPTVSGAVESGLTEGAKGAVLGASIPALAGLAGKVIPTKQNILDDLLKIKPSEEGKMQRSVSGGYVQAAEKVTPYLKSGDDVPAFIEASEKALDDAAKEFRPVIEKASPTYLAPDDLYARVDKQLESAIPNPDTRQALLLEQGDFLSDLTKITPQNFLQYARKINKEISRIYKNPSTPITSESLAAKEAIRDVYAETIRKILEDAGQDPSVYSGYGAIKEMSSQIGKNYLQATYKLSEEGGRGMGANFLAGVEGGKNSAGAIVSGAKSALSTMTEGEKGRMDAQIKKLNSNFVANFIGYGREKTNDAKAAKLDAALRFLNSSSKDRPDPLVTAEEASKLVQ